MADPSSSTPLIGLEAWNARRANWTKPSPEFDEEKFNQHLNSKVFTDMVNDSTRKQRAYSFLVRQLREFNQPVPLKYIVSPKERGAK
jgi:hypothetical protein